MLEMCIQFQHPKKLKRIKPKKLKSQNKKYNIFIFLFYFKCFPTLGVF